MSTRLVRTDTIANIADFGALENNVGAAATNAEAFRLAIESGARRIAVPAGTWYFSEILYPGPVAPYQLPADIEIFGEGRQRTFLCYRPAAYGNPAFTLHPGTTPISRSLLRDFQLIGPVSPGIGTYAVSTGIYLYNTQHNVLRDLEIWNFAVGIECPAGVNAFTGYTAIERFLIAGCEIGIRLRDGSNGMLISSGRILGSLKSTGGGDPVVVTAEEGIGIDIEGTNGTSGPGGGSGVVISAVQIESTPLCIRIVKSHDIAVVGCYLEPGNRHDPNTIRGIRRVIEVDDLSERIAILATVQSEPAALPPSQTEDLTPNYVAQVPEARGVIDLNAFDDTGTNYTDRAYGAGIHGATAAHANHLRNGDMSRGVLFWERSAVGINVVVEDGLGEYVTGGRALRIESSSTSDHHLYQDFQVDAGVRSITAMVRYYIKDEAAAFRVSLATISTASVVTEIGYFSETENFTDGWRVRALTARFDGTLTGLVGPRRFRIRLYPYNAQAGGEAGHAVHVDSVWVVDGEYAAPYRPYQEGVEVLAGDNRVVLFGGTAVTSPVGPTGFPSGFLVPANAVGMVTEMSISSALASTNVTTLRVDDGTGTDNIRDVYAFANNRTTITEYTVPLVPGAAPQWSMAGAVAGNAVTYAVRLKAWIYRL